MEKNQQRIDQLERIAARIRGKLVEMSHCSKASHLGSALSCVDILVSLYWDVLDISPDNADRPDRDRFILSKGHGAAALYATLAYRGVFEKEFLDTYAGIGSRLEEHPGPGSLPGVEAATGSLGHGMSMGVGLAMAARIRNLNYKTVILVSDGECNEGAVWEGAMFASGQHLDNICVIVDFNKWQATGRSREVMGLDPLLDKWESFGWEGIEVDGHDLSALRSACARIGNSAGKPLAIVAHTVKGKGVSFMEDDNNWHYRIPDASEVLAAKKELGVA